MRAITFIALLSALFMACGITDDELKSATKDTHVWSIAEGLRDHGPLIVVVKCECLEGHGWEATLRDTSGNYYTLPGSEAANVNSFGVGDTIQ